MKINYRKLISYTGLTLIIAGTAWEVHWTPTILIVCGSCLLVGVLFSFTPDNL